MTSIAMKMFMTIILIASLGSGDFAYENRVQMDENYLLQWSVKVDDIVLEMHVKSHGYMGFGLSRDGTVYGADIFISWMDDGHIFFYDCHIRTHTQTHEPVVDSSQDYEVLAGSENATHTIIRFKRKLNTCDDKFDVPITNDTMHVIFLYHDEKPKRGQMRSDNALNPMLAIQSIRPLLLLQRSPSILQQNPSDTFEIKNEKVKVLGAGLHKWCRSYKITHRNHQIIRYEPSFNPPEAENFITLMRLYECRKAISENFNGECSEKVKMDRKCFSTIAMWTRGSDGFTYPSDVGYPLDASISDNFLLEVHYQDADLIDSSGFRIFHTSERRKFEAGTISINIRPNFLHIIAPGFYRVLSVGHCSSNCTQKIEDLNVFGVSMLTHSAGTKVKITLVRNGEELEPLAEDSNIIPSYLETRLLNTSRSVQSGDHLTVECTYNTFKRERFTLGGESSNEEVCVANVLYYPRQEQLVACSSQSKISDVLKALGIEELGKSSNQTVITKPDRYSGRTLEKHLELYDWKNEFFTFENIIKTSSYESFCSSATNMMRITGTIPAINKPYRPPDFSCPSTPNKFNNEEETHENSIDGEEKSKAVRSPSTFQQQRSGNECSQATVTLIIMAIFCIVAV